MDCNRSNHKRALDSLCFVCGSLVKKTGGSYFVKDLVDFLTRTLRYPELFEIQGITPEKLCRLCYQALVQVDEGKTMKSGKTMVEWTECGPCCNACNMLQKSEKQHVGRKKKVSELSILRNMSPLHPCPYWSEKFGQTRRIPPPPPVRTGRLKGPRHIFSFYIFEIFVANDKSFALEPY